MSDPGDESTPRKPHQITVAFETLDGMPTAGLVRTMEWWAQTAIEDFQTAAPKVGEYGGTDEGSADLRIMGFALSELRMPPGSSPAVQQEVACWFYSLGKIARLISDYNQGRPGKTDSWHDISVYSMMARRLQESGNWP